MAVGGHVCTTAPLHLHCHTSLPHLTTYQVYIAEDSGLSCRMLTEVQWGGLAELVCNCVCMSPDSLSSMTLSADSVFSQSQLQSML